MFDVKWIPEHPEILEFAHAASYRCRETCWNSGVGAVRMLQDFRKPKGGPPVRLKSALKRAAAMPLAHLVLVTKSDKSADFRLSCQ